MGTSTTKLGLFKPEPEDICDVNSAFGDNFSKLELYIAFVECTSGTRPASPFDGMKIRETDTDLLYIRVSGAWVLMVDVPAVVASGGRKAYATVTANSSVAGTTEIDMGLKVTFTAELARRYWVESSFVTTNQNPGEEFTAQFNLRWASGASVTTAGTSINGSRPCELQPLTFDTDDMYYIHEFVPNIAGSVTVGWFAKVTALGTGNGIRREAGTAADASKSIIIVRDVGV